MHLHAKTHTEGTKNVLLMVLQQQSKVPFGTIISESVFLDSTTIHEHVLTQENYCTVYCQL